MKANRTILFVEDNPLVLAVYRNRLQSEGYTVEAVGDGVAALEALPRLKPGLVILDLMLPKLNGSEVLKFIREHGDLKMTPVLILSNAYLDDRASQAMTAGASKRLPKTQCTPAKLIEAIRELLGAPDEVKVRNGGEAKSAPPKSDAALQEARDRLLKDAPSEISKIREYCLAFVKTGGSDAGLEHLNHLYQHVRILCARAGLGDCTKIAHLSSALEAILFEIIFKKSTPTPSALQTIAQAVDCLGRLFQNQQIDSLDSTLKAKVLIVDDDPVCNFATVAAMKRARLDAVSTENPADALELAQGGHYDIVLLDINMPKLTGFEVCEKIRQISGYQKTPVIFVTSNGEFQNRAKAVLSGGNDLIAKPISPLELALKTIMHLIEPRAEKVQTENKAQPAQAVATDTTPPRAEHPEKSNGKLDIKIKMPSTVSAPVEKTGNKTNGVSENSRETKRHLPPAIPFEAPKIFEPETTAEEPSANRIYPLPINHDTAMKNKNENSQPLDQLAREVTRIIFGDDISEMSVRLTRIALERYGVPEIISGAPGTNGSKNAAPFDRVNREVARIIFGDDISEMHLRLTRIALERYNVPEILNHSGETNWRNGASESYIHAAVNL